MKKRILALLLASIALLSLTVMMMTSCKKKEEDPKLPPDYAPPAQEEGATDIEEGYEEKLEVEAGGGAVGLIYSDEVTIDLSENKATFRFDNPRRSYNNIIVQLVIQDTVIFETGSIAPGKRVTEITLKEGAAERLDPGVYAENAEFMFHFYDPETNERAIVNTKIPVTVTVQE